MAHPQEPRRRPKRSTALRARGELTRDLTLAARLGLSLDEFYKHPDAEDHIAVWENEQQVCRHHGGPISECPDDEKDWFPQRHICYVEMQLKAAQRAYDERHKGQPFHDGTFTHWAEKWSPHMPFHYMDGVTIWMSETDVNPDDKFLG